MWKSLGKWLLKNVVEDLVRELLAKAEKEVGKKVDIG